MNLQEAQAPIDLEIVRALIAATPETWMQAELVAERSEADRHEKITITISSPEARPETVSATDELQEAIFRLADTFASFGKVWRTVYYRAKANPDGGWSFEANFSY